MRLLFRPRDLACWARFSGDFNPIHFDIGAARAAGADDLIVHGMLALLPIKHLLWEHARPAGGEDGWLRFRAMLRRPVLVGRRHVVSLAERARGRLDFSLRDERSSEELLRGFAGPCEAPELSGDAAQRPMADGAVDWSSFCADFPFSTDPWTYLDGLAFAAFVRSHANIADVLPAEGRPPWLRPDGAGSLLMQTGQETFIHPAVRQMHEQGAIAPNLAGLGYAIATELAGVSDAEAVGSARVTLYLRDRAMVISRFGLIAKRISTSGEMEDEQDTGFPQGTGARDHRRGGKRAVG